MNRGIATLVLAAAAAAAGQTNPQTFEELSTMAQRAYEADHLDQAGQLYSSALKLRPDWTQGWWAMGMIDYQLDQYPQCRDALAKMVELDASAAPGWALLGLCEFRIKQYEAAFQHLKRAHMLVPLKQAGGQLLDMADYHLALLLTRQGAFEVAQEVLVRVAQSVRDNPEMTLASGLTSLRMPLLPADLPEDRRDVVTMAGKAFWDLATRPPAEAEADFRALVTKYPKFPNVHYFYGTYLAAHHPEQCAQEFLKELQITPDSVPARVQLTLRYLVEGKGDEAGKLAREAVVLSPDSVGAQLALAKTLEAQGNEEDALAALVAAKRLDPISPKIRLYLADAYRALHRVEDMRRELADFDRLKAEEANWP